MHGNESADKFAVKATTQQTRSDLKSYIKKTYIVKWREILNAKQTKKYQKLQIIYKCYLTPHPIVVGKNFSQY